MNTGVVELKIEPVLLQKIQIRLLYLSRLAVVLSHILFPAFHMQGCSFQNVRESNKNQKTSKPLKTTLSTRWVAFASREALLACDP